MKKLIILSAVLIAGVAAVGAQASTYVLTGSDAKLLYGSFQYALENSPTRQATGWSNAATGLTGLTIPIATYRTSDWQNCRDYFTSLQIAGINQQVVGTACRQPEGYWKVISEQPIGTHPKRVQNSNVIAGHPSCSSKRSVQPPLGQAAAPMFPQTKRHLHVNPHNNIHGNKYLHGRPQNHQGMPQAKPKKQQLRYPSKLIKLVDYHGG